MLSLESLHVTEPNDTKPEIESDFDVFCRAMGWTKMNGVLPTKPDKIPKRLRQLQEMDLTVVHKDFTKTDVAKEMRGSILNGIETKHDLKMPTEREALRARKVIFFSFYYNFKL